MQKKTVRQDAGTYRGRLKMKQTNKKWLTSNKAIKKFSVSNWMTVGDEVGED